MTAPAPAAILEALAAGPLDVYQLSEALNADTGSVVKALNLLEEAGTVTRSANNIYDLTDAGRSAVGDALTAAIFAEEDERAALVAAIDDGMSYSPHGRVVARIEHGEVVWRAPGFTASTAPTTNALTASAEDATGEAFKFTYPSAFGALRRPLQRSHPPLQASRTVGGGSARPASPKIAKARALIASAAAGLDAYADTPDGTTLRLDAGRVR